MENKNLLCVHSNFELINEYIDYAFDKFHLNKPNKFLNEDKIFINVDDYSYNTYENILKIRLIHQYSKPIILFGIYDIDNLLEHNPKNIIFLSPNCKYYRLDQFIEKFNNRDFDQINIKEVIQKINLKNYLTPFIDIVNYRHSYANYWSIFLTYLVTVKGSKNIENPDNKFIFDQVKSDIGSGAHNTKTVDFLKSLDCYIWQEYYLSKFNINNKIELNKVKKIDKKIFLIDDQAADGWHTGLNRLFESNALISLKKDDIILDKIIEKISSDKPDVIFLDLRLDAESGKTDYKELESFKIFNEIKSEFDGLPIIIFSATSNVDIIKYYLENGAKGVWTKPGIDENLDHRELVERFNYLIELFNKNVEFDVTTLNKLFDDNTKDILQIQNISSSYERYLTNKFAFIKPKFESIDQYDVVYFDTNLFLTVKNEPSNQKKHAQDIPFNNYFKAFILTSLYREGEKMDFHVSTNSLKDAECASTVVLNSVFDEIIKYLKIDDKKSLPANIYTPLIKKYFNNNILRAEWFTHKKDSKNKYMYIKDPKEKVGADGYIYEYVLNEIKEKKDAKILVVSNDSDISSTFDDIIKLSNITVMKLDAFVKIFDSFN